MVRLVLLVSAIAALAAALALPLVLAILRRRTGFAFGGTEVGRIIASDVGIGAELILRDEELGLSGKPDYLVASGTDDRLIPFEVKPKRRSPRLYESDRVQIGAYLLALRATADERASSVGYVRYQTGTFEVALTPKLETEIRQLIATLRRARQVAVIHRSHSSPARCRACAVRHQCDEALA